MLNYHLPNIHFAIAWNHYKNIGDFYNDFMNMVGYNDWVCFIDGDAMHTHTYFGTNIAKVIINNPNYDLFTCYTNRIGCNWQILKNVDKSNNDISYHREISKNQWIKYQTHCTNVTNFKPFLSGFMILLNKKSWLKFGEFKSNGMLGIDNNYHEQIKNNGGKIGRADGIYIYHWYRNNNHNELNHLI